MWSCMGVLLLISSTVAFDMEIYHTNDMHSKLQEVTSTLNPCNSTEGETCFGSYARAAQLARDFMAVKNHSVFLNAGDHFSGSSFYTYFGWRPLSVMVNKMGFTAMSLGNHEFDEGVTQLMYFLQNIKVPVLACNLDASLEPSLHNGTNIKKWISVDIDGVKVAIVGYLTPDTMYLANTGKVKILPEIPEIKKCARKARESGAKIVIAVGHSGYDVDQKIAAEVEDIDVIVGGHSHSFLCSGKPPDIDKPVGPYPTMVKTHSGKEIPIVQAFHSTKYLGRLQLTWDENFKLKSAYGNPILLDSSVPKDVEMYSYVTDLKIQLRHKLEQVVGHTSVDLIGDRCRFEECNIGDFITASLVKYVALTDPTTSGWTPASIAILHSGSIRGSIYREKSRGNITVEDIMNIFPFKMRIMIVTLSGDVLFRIMERSVERYDMDGVIGRGEFLQVSGLKVVYDLYQPPLNRVVQLEALCSNCSVPDYQPVNRTNYYPIIINSFLANGGDGYYMFQGLPPDRVYDVLISDIVQDTLNTTNSVVQELDGRIKFNSASLTSSPRLNLVFVFVFVLYSSV